MSHAFLRPKGVPDTEPAVGEVLSTPDGKWVGRYFTTGEKPFHEFSPHTTRYWAKHDVEEVVDMRLEFRQWAH